MLVAKWLDDWRAIQEVSCGVVVTALGRCEGFDLWPDYKGLA
jgi:hypothetical protein